MGGWEEVLPNAGLDPGFLRRGGCDHTLNYTHVKRVVWAWLVLHSFSGDYKKCEGCNLHNLPSLSIQPWGWNRQWVEMMEGGGVKDDVNGMIRG